MVRPGVVLNENKPFKRILFYFHILCYIIYMLKERLLKTNFQPLHPRLCLSQLLSHKETHYNLRHLKFIKHQYN